MKFTRIANNLLDVGNSSNTLRNYNSLIRSIVFITCQYHFQNHFFNFKWQTIKAERTS